MLEDTPMAWIIWLAVVILMLVGILLLFLQSILDLV